MTLGQKIYARRMELGLSLRELSNIIGVSKSTISRWETGNIEHLRVEHIEALANALYVSPLYLIGVSNDKPNIIAERICNRIKKMSIPQLEKLESMIDLMFK